MLIVMISNIFGYGITYGDLLNGMIDDWSNHLTWSDQSDFTNAHAPTTSGVTLVVKNGKDKLTNNCLISF